MIEELEDWEAWDRFPQHRWIFNKLELSLKLGYLAGPTPLPVSKTGEYIVRPIYNLSGLAAGAKFMQLEKDKIYDLPPSYFWCERFFGEHVSVNYVWNDNKLIPVHFSIGETDYNNLSRFKRWVQVDHRDLELPDWIDSLRSVNNINIEFVGGKIIEIHLRHGVDFPDGAREIIPVWSTTPKEDVDSLMQSGYKFLESYTNAENNIEDPRLGHLWK